MKIIQIQGGLGNQLFLYVYWQWLVKRYADDNLYGVYPHRGLSCHNGLEIQKWFDIEMPPVSLSSKIIGETCFWLNKILRRLHLPIPYCSDDANPKPDALFHDGYFQDLKYQEGVIMPSFRDDLSLDENNKKILEKLCKENAVAVHVRRGDYHKNKITNQIYGGICTEGYYQKAIEVAKAEIKNAKFFFFSDDEKYVKSTFNVDNMTIVNINKGDRSFFDMYLMAHAGNMILANSTFSCWAAYLNKNVKNVYCPSRWVNIEPKPNLIKTDWKIIQ